MWDGVPFCIFGVAPGGEEGVGSVWMLGTDAVIDAAHYLRMFTLSWVEWMNTLYPVLANSCHEDNALSIAWLEYAGFVFGDPYPHPTSGQTFVPFWRTNV